MSGVTEIRKASRVVHLVLPSDVSSDLARILSGAADEIERLRAERDRWRKHVYAWIGCYGDGEPTPSFADFHPEGEK